MLAGKAARDPFRLDRLQRLRDHRARRQARARRARRRRPAAAAAASPPAPAGLGARLAVEQEPVDRLGGADPVGERLGRIERRHRPPRRAASPAAWTGAAAPRPSAATSPIGRQQGGEAADRLRRDPGRRARPRPERRSRSADSISGSTGLKMPRSIISATVGAGSGRPSSFSSSSAIRSRDSAIRSLARAAQASSAGRSGAPAPKRAWKRKKRRMRR